MDIVTPSDHFFLHIFLSILSGARLSPLGTAATVWSTVPAPDDLRIVWGGVQTGSTRHRGHLLSYEDWQEKPKYSEKTCPSATL
jgi:hypothetical protein